MAKSWRTSADSDRLAWPILLLLLLVLVPSLGVVWLMREAVLNERLATSQRLREAYQAQLRAATQSVKQRWETQLAQVDELVENLSPAEAFDAIVREGLADSVLVLAADATVLYPNQAESRELPSVFESSAWKAAENLEYTANNYAAAAEAFGALAENAGTPVEKAYSQQAQERCLLKAGRKEEAIQVLESLSEFGDLRDQQGRSFAAAAEIRLLQVLEKDSDEWNHVAQQLSERLQDYRPPTLISPQRRFLMAELQQLAHFSTQFPTQQAEELAAASLVEINPTTVFSDLRRGPEADVWSQATPSRRGIVLFRTGNLRQRLLDWAEDVPLSSEVEFALQIPQDDAPLMVAESLGRTFGDLILGLAATGDDPFQVSSQQRTAVLIWIAVLIVAASCFLAWILAGLLRRRLHLARLKNDLVATVSHELKTPLASIRLLVDTLLDGEHNPNVDQHEYLQLISRENARLTRLIDNFLTFSRLERGVQRFEFQSLDVRQVVEQAAEIFREHCNGTADYLEVSDGESAAIWGDADALVTAVLNLLENAWKYSADEKRIILSTEVVGGQVVISVEDNGIGLNPRAAGRVFDKFYQVDQRVARTQGGCGLGLSIVRAIARSHGGEAKVESEQGRGSTFRLCLPRHHDRAGDVAVKTVQGVLQ